MRRIALGSFLLISVVLIPGCGTGAPLPSAPAASHGGNLASLPGNRGFFEIVIDGGDSRRVGRAAAVKSRLTAFFYGLDGTTELAPTPTDVKVKTGGSESGRIVALLPVLGFPGKFSSEPDIFPDGFRGQLEAQLGGETIQTPFSIR